ncbi:hypothetical protein OSTOST_17941, partial [Ostertagia ostertagi]
LALFAANPDSTARYFLMTGFLQTILLNSLLRTSRNYVSPMPPLLSTSSFRRKRVG